MDSLAYQEFFVKKKFVVPEKQLWLLEQSAKQFFFYKEKLESKEYSPMEDQSHKFLRIYSETLREIASRIYPKLTSIDANITGDPESLGFKIVVEDRTIKKLE